MIKVKKLNDDVFKDLVGVSGIGDLPEDVIAYIRYLEENIIKLRNTVIYDLPKNFRKGLYDAIESDVKALCYIEYDRDLRIPVTAGNKEIWEIVDSIYEYFNFK